MLRKPRVPHEQHSTAKHSLRHTKLAAHPHASQRCQLRKSMLQAGNVEKAQGAILVACRGR